VRTVEVLSQDWLLATQIHKLEARLWRKTQREGLRVIMITSAIRGEGKSTTVAFLSTALGLHPDRRILAVDLDFRDPQLSGHFGVESALGVGAVLRGERRVEEIVVKTDLPSLELLLPGADGEDPELLLRTVECGHLFDQLRKDYDLVLVDVPALIPVADASGLLPLVDGVVLMAMAGQTTRPQLNRAREACLGMGANILGLVIGNLQEAVPEYGYGGYAYGYAKRRPMPGRESGSTTRR
jgi:capsular exopolysaccharide synthesis family protein